MDIRQRPLLVTADPLLLDDLLRLATAASTEVTVSRTPDRALSLWPHAPLVVVGADLRSVLRDADPPPARHVVVVRRAQDPPGAPHDGAEPPSTPKAGPSGHRGDPSAGPDGERLLLLPRDETALVELFTRASTPDRAPAPLVSVLGGRGGAGASLLAVALALAGERAGRSTALLDADPLGCGSDLYLGCDQEPHPGPYGRTGRTGWNDLLRRSGHVPWRDLRPGLPGTPGISVLTWTRGHEPSGPLTVGTVRAVLSSARSGADLVVADLPRSFDPATVVFLNRSELVLLVVPADVPSVAAASRVLSRLREEARAVRVVVRGARGELSADVVAHSLKAVLGADLPPEPGLARLLDAGDVPARHPRSPLARFCDRLVAGLGAPGRER
ncbi:septum site-determining protein Ssd [Nocardiopsis sp. ATB16-24]|uniref:septum site-determining protein Ssd n=1 Tax=Nocardiopsis sp. ATB16-24 TaxID=3019555 RepID=UPI0025534B60|nr:septum site-determining protein Ssd [Nocardiopsis sp. ATB16-24]